MSANKELKTQSIEDLPNDFLFYLFSDFLDFNSKIESQKVCKLWKQLIDFSFRSKRCLIISDYELNDNRINRLNLSQKKVSVIKMVSFHLIDRTENKDKKFISMVLKKHQNLKTLCICLKFTKCNNKYFELIAKYCSDSLTNLRIELSECSVNNRTLIVGLEEMALICEKIPNLKYFYIDFVILFIYERSLQTLFSKWPQIETVIFHTPCFRGCVYNSELENTLSSEFIGDHFMYLGPSVIKMEVPGNVLNWNAINRIPTNTNLKRLLVFKLNLNSIEAICEKFPKLDFFGFSIENETNEDDMYNLLEKIGSLHHLEQLYMAITNGIAINHNCVKLLRSCVRLKSLQIDQTLLSKEGMEAIIKFFPTLQNLEVWTSGLNQNFHHCLNDSIAIDIKKLKFLKSLNLRGQRNILDNTIANIITNCLLLQSIDVRTTKAAIITLKVLIEKCKTSKKTMEVYIHETPISRIFSQDFKRFEICEHLLLNNEDYDYKINF